MSDGDYERRDGRMRELAAMNARLAEWRREAEARAKPDGATRPAQPAADRRP